MFDLQRRRRYRPLQHELHVRAQGPEASRRYELLASSRILGSGLEDDCRSLSRIHPATSRCRSSVGERCTAPDIVKIRNRVWRPK